MGAHDAPHWLLPAFVRSVSALGATAPRDRIEATGRRLLERWSSADRHHHGVTHLVAVLQRVDALAQETHDPEVVRVAAWYHGAVFDTKPLNEYLRVAGENKPASAVLAKAELLELGVPERIAGRVHDIILSLTRHDADPADVDCLALCDADLGTLAVEPQKYKDYRKRVRDEFAHIDPRSYVEARIAIITRLLARRRLFLSPLATAWEEPARQNLAAELVKLKAELAALPPRAEGETVPVPMPATPHAGARHETSHFGRDESRTPSAQWATGTIPLPPTAVTNPASPADDDDPELIGVPFEERRTAPARREDLAATSGIERVPQGARDVPRRVSIVGGTSTTSPNAPSAHTPVSPSASTPATPGTQTQTAPGPDDAAPATTEGAPATTEGAPATTEGAPRTAPSTRTPDDDASTGSLFRPVER